MVTSRKLLRVYVDETGDRGTSARSSPFFAFAAVLVADEDEAALRNAMTHLRTTLKAPSGAALHWNKHVKTFSRRQHVTSTLAVLRQVSVVYVVVDKAAIPAGSGMLEDHVLFYNFAAGLVLERAVLAARNWPGGQHQAIIRFGHVRGFDHATSRDYFDRKRTASTPGCSTPRSIPTISAATNPPTSLPSDISFGVVLAAKRGDGASSFSATALRRRAYTQ